MIFIAKQSKAAYSKYDLLISTPMRIVALLRASAIDLSAVETVVLDEGLCS
jgi:superfamily II DNA/RNA helicase